MRKWVPTGTRERVQGLSCVEPRGFLTRFRYLALGQGIVMYDAMRDSKGGRQR